MATRDRDDLRGYALLNIETGRERDFFSRLYDIPGIEDVYFMGDGYEFMVSVRAKDQEEIARIMAQRIRRLPGLARMASYVEGRYLK